MTRRVLSMDDLPAPEPYRLLTALVVPRPIAWVSTLDAQGRANLAPHSFFTVASGAPPIVQFTSVGRKDSLRNIEATGEFVVNLASRALLEPMNATSATAPPEVDEFELAGLEKERSTKVAPWRVAASPAALECELHQVVPVGDSFVVMGRVVVAAVDESVLDDDGRPMEWLLDPLARLSGSRYVTYGRTVNLPRPK
ncbi:flavin reductase family protein [Calidifontibacter indicus]|uniref:Flavin reductase (DIM6/NTAB) family NADH-FMN oxidoreductase RutF n=1 Tax=Calidifontibacter indicus TaxID=419650 RepID=A0A3D9UND7_9MICO|nr:flavin reductase family protein [Calidifontibacter indicus]REF30837.1 flavin reductase (DIM6/NTAB) family NADH-FMN oxidoreductase RutF [Calidifontibacter indicus]